MPRTVWLTVSAGLPVTARRTLSRTEARAVYDRIGRWQDTQAWYEDPALDALIAGGGFEEVQSIFEVGCGTGRLAGRLLRDHCSPDASYRGVDLSSRMVEIARHRLAPFSDRADVFQSDGGFDFSQADGSQDRVVAAYLLDLLSESDIRAFLTEAHRLLTPTGRLCLAGLTTGKTLLGWGVSSLWSAVHAIRPESVGGCRPLRMAPFLDASRWDVLHREIVRAWGVPSEVLIASPK